MLKLKITGAALALAGMMLLILGGTYMSVSLAIGCTAAASSLALHAMLKWTSPKESGFRKFTLTAWTSGITLAAIGALQKMGVYDIPLNTPIDPAQSVKTVGSYVLLLGAFSIFMAVIVPWSSPKWDDDDED